MSELEELRRRIKAREADLLKSIEEGVVYFSQTSQTSEFRRFHIEILRILKRLSILLRADIERLNRASH
jgi:hypothetical protein